MTSGAADDRVLPTAASEPESDVINRREFLWTCGCATCASAAIAAPAKKSKLAIAACGGVCTDCGIFKAANDRAAAERMAKAWRGRGHADAQADWFQCQGCHGPDKLVWSAKCKIRACCLKKRKLSDCSQCTSFPCEEIVKFEKDGHKHHRQAVERLRTRRAKRDAAKKAAPEG